jgi:mono/diheme cytochrome c family protein
MKRIFLSGALLVFASVSAFAVDAKDTYMNKCSVCHGPDGAGKTAKGRKLKVKDVHETSKKVSAAEMIKIVEEGKGVDMDAFGKDLSKADIKAVVDYYRDFAK